MKVINDATIKIYAEQSEVAERVTILQDMNTKISIENLRLLHKFTKANDYEKVNSKIQKANKFL